MSEEHVPELVLTEAPKGGTLFDILVPEARLCVLAQDIYESTYEDVVRALTWLTKQGPEDIHLHITSGGGNAFTGLALADAIESLQRDTGVQIIGQAMGQCMSAAMLPFMACSKRFMGARSWLMMHGASNSMFRADMRNMEAEMALTTQMNQQLAEWFASRSKQPTEFWLPLLKDNTPHYWSASEALEDGLTDAIL